MIDIVRKRGDTYPTIFVLTNKETRQPYADISDGYSFVLVVDPDPFPIGTTGNVFASTGEVLDGATARVGFPLSANDANNVGEYYYEAQMVDPSGYVRTFASGRYTFVQDLAK
jgi:hypothetical protein